jgi:hypothetical protein
MPRVFSCPHTLDPRAADARRDRQAVRHGPARSRGPELPRAPVGPTTTAPERRSDRKRAATTALPPREKLTGAFTCSDLRASLGLAIAPDALSGAGGSVELASPARSRRWTRIGAPAAASLLSVDSSDIALASRARAATLAVSDHVTAWDDTRARRPGACRRPQPRAKRARKPAPGGRTSLDRRERGRADPSPTGPSIRARAPVRGRRAADAAATQPAARYRRPAGGVMVVLNQQRAPRRSPAPRSDRLAVLTLLGIVTARAPEGAEVRDHAGPDPPRGRCARSHGHFSSSPCRTHPGAARA